MKTIEQVQKAINHRIKQLEILNEQLLELTKDDDKKDLMHVYFENDARLSELISLLEYMHEDCENET